MSWTQLEETDGGQVYEDAVVIRHSGPTFSSFLFQIEVT
jgi:hypothetical protein